MRFELDGERQQIEVAAGRANQGKADGRTVDGGGGHADLRQAAQARDAGESLRTLAEGFYGLAGRVAQGRRTGRGRQADHAVVADDLSQATANCRARLVYRRYVAA